MKNETDIELIRCAEINFGNFERANPTAVQDPYYRIAKAQLTEGLGGKKVEESLGVKDV